MERQNHIESDTDENVLDEQISTYYVDPLAKSKLHQRRKICEARERFFDFLNIISKNVETDETDSDDSSENWKSSQNKKMKLASVWNDEDNYDQEIKVDNFEEDDDKSSCVDDNTYSRDGHNDFVDDNEDDMDSKNNAIINFTSVWGSPISDTEHYWMENEVVVVPAKVKPDGGDMT